MAYREGRQIPGWEANSTVDNGLGAFDGQFVPPSVEED